MRPHKGMLFDKEGLLVRHQETTGWRASSSQTSVVKKKKWRALTPVKTWVKNRLTKQISSTHFNPAIIVLIGTAEVIGLRTYNAEFESQNLF